jgi:two-component system sensor histidine kinase BaeS
MNRRPPRNRRWWSGEFPPRRPGESFPRAHGPFRGPPWEGHGQMPSSWAMHGRSWPGGRRFLFWRFAATFGAMMFFVASGIAILALTFTRLLGGNTQMALLTWLGVCGLAIVLPMIGFGIASRVSRDITSPLADIMAAADRVAAGDLSIRVGENISSQFGQLARIFNRMVEELQRIDEQRRNLTADVAHELRTPLHIIQGNLEGILDGVYEPTPEHIQMLLDETIILSRLVEDLRTLSQAESGHLPLHRRPVVVAELLADLATSFSGQADVAEITLHVETARLAGTTVDADLLRLNQMLANLIVNALRYTPEGGKIALRGEPTSAGVRLTISDTGQGISPEDLPHIFDRFWRGDHARSHKDGAGGGLGLAIVRQLVELHGGHIAVQSAPGVGTTFTIDLPATAPPPEQ